MARATPLKDFTSSLQTLLDHTSSLCLKDVTICNAYCYIMHVVTSFPHKAKGVPVLPLSTADFNGDYLSIPSTNIEKYGKKSLLHVYFKCTQKLNAGL